MQRFALTLALALASLASHAALPGGIESRAPFNEVWLEPGQNLQVISGGRSNTTFRLAPGYYYLGSTNLDIPNNVSVIGAGMMQTVIVGQGGVGTNGTVVVPGNNTVLANLTIDCGSRSNFYQAGCCSYSQATYGNKPFTNAVISQVRVLGDSDAWMLSHTQALSARMYGIVGISKFDCYVQTGNTSNDVELIDPVLIVQQPSAVSPGSVGRVVNLGDALTRAGRLKITGGSIVMSNGQAGATAIQCNNLGSAPAGVLELAGPSLSVRISGGTEGTHVYNPDNGAGASTVRVCGNCVEKGKTTGPLTYPILTTHLTNVVWGSTEGLQFCDYWDNDAFTPNPTKFVRVGGASGGVYVGSQTDPAGHLAVGPAGYGIKVAEGGNARMGSGTLASGALTVSTTAVSTNSRIFLTAVDTTTAIISALSVTNIVAATSFKIQSSLATDNRRVDWIFFDPAP